MRVSVVLYSSMILLVLWNDMTGKTEAQSAGNPGNPGSSSSSSSSSQSQGRGAQPPLKPQSSTPLYQLTTRDVARGNCRAKDIDVYFQSPGCNTEMVSMKSCSGTCFSYYGPSPIGAAEIYNKCAPTTFRKHTITFTCPTRSSSLPPVTKEIKIANGCGCRFCSEN